MPRCVYTPIAYLAYVLSNQVRNASDAVGAPCNWLQAKRDSDSNEVRERLRRVSGYF